MDANSPSRRWFRFSLRTLFILVTVVALWLGYYANWMRQRGEARVWLDECAPSPFAAPFLTYPRLELSWPLRLLGERPETLYVVC
jgi:hypothetical protein